jgi:hypothetical protein
MPFLILWEEVSLKENKKRDKPKKNDLSQSVLKAGLEPARAFLPTGF